MVTRFATSSVVLKFCSVLVMLSAVVSGTVAHAQVTAQTLIGKAVSDDAANTEVTGAINRFRDRDIDG